MFHKFRSFLRFPRFDQFWLFPVVVALLVAKLMIWVVSFRRLSPLLGAQTGVAPWTPVINPARTHRACQITRVVNRASHYTLTEVNCFPKALVARILFGIYRIPYCLFFGLRRDDATGKFDAHAWIVSGDAYLGMRSSFRRYQVLNVFASPSLWADMRREMLRLPDGNEAPSGATLQHSGGRIGGILRSGMLPAKYTMTHGSTSALSLQRLFDILFAGMALLVLAPLLLPITILLRLTGEGEVLFRQSRVGLGGKPFQLLKFATMLKESPNLGTGTVTLKDDPRVLPVGRFLRASKLNELPQLVNILRGDMSLIGPRPQTQRCFDAFPESSQQVITCVPPGLSGIGSVIFRGEDRMLHDADDATRLYDEIIMPYKAKLEEWYVAHRGPTTYFLLITITVWVVLFRNHDLVWRVFPDLPKPPEKIMPLI